MLTDSPGIDRIDWSERVAPFRLARVVSERRILRYGISGMTGNLLHT